MKKRDKLVNNKKAELTSKHIVGLVILVVGFAILLLLYWQISWTGNIDREVCHQSVILRATAPDTVLGTKDYVPLKCATRKICITDKFFGKGDCEEFAGEKYEKVRISGSELERQEQINMFIAREMADCWAMMGEGKVQVFARELVSTSAKRECSICARIAFDKSLKEEIGEVKGLGEYLISHKVPNKDISYWEFLTHRSKIPIFNKEFDSFSMDEKTIVFMEMDKNTLGDWLGLSGGGLIGAKIGATIGSIVPLGGTIAGAAIGFIGGAIVGDMVGKDIGDAVSEMGDAKFASSSFFMDYDASKLQGLECQSFQNIP